MKPSQICCCSLKNSRQARFKCQGGTQNTGCLLPEKLGESFPCRHLLELIFEGYTENTPEVISGTEKEHY
jgi:hypothetical protein